MISTPLTPRRGACRLHHGRRHFPEPTAQCVSSSLPGGSQPNPENSASQDNAEFSNAPPGPRAQSPISSHPSGGIFNQDQRKWRDLGPKAQSGGFPMPPRAGGPGRSFPVCFRADGPRWNPLTRRGGQPWKRPPERKSQRPKPFACLASPEGGAAMPKTEFSHEAPGPVAPSGVLHLPGGQAEKSRSPRPLLA